MNLSSLQPVSVQAVSQTAAGMPQSPDDEARETFTKTLGEMLFREMIKSMRRTVDEPAYFHGGRAEEMFTSQLDQLLSEKMGQTHGEEYFGPMYDAWANR